MDTVKSFLGDILGAVDAGYADARLQESEHTRIVYRGRELDDVSRATERGGCIRLFINGNWGIATFNTIDESLRELAQEVERQTRALPRREAAVVPLGPHEDIVRLKPEDDPRRVSLEEKNRLISRYNDILLKTPGIVSTNSLYTDTHRFVSLLSTDGRYIDQEQVYTGFACSAVAKDGVNIQTYADSFGKTQGFSTLADREPIVERIAKVALDLLKAEPVPAGTYTVIIDPLLAGVFAHEAFGHLSEADFIAENERLRELMQKGTRYGEENLTIVDDATLPGERGSYRYDDEGAPAQRTELLRRGVLAGHLTDRETAARLGEPPSGNSRAMSYRYPPIVRMSNTCIEPGDAELDDMLDIEKGLYVAGSRGGMTELESFTFASQYAYMVERGRRTRMVRDVTLTGNVFETLRNIEMVGDDPVLFGGIGGCGKGGQSPLPVGMGAPHLRIRNVVMGGR
jgi:TldD protein